ncbi:uncharacterized protein LOC142645774 [Dermatophagoides pteronyssinus]|uniref:uncharacterized protein LOC142645774 n=1 Tax=Dermatophagoides pteronyssinus TaxID=6956 RepID=UPI003F66C58D
MIRLYLLIFGLSMLNWMIAEAQTTNESEAEAETETTTTTPKIDVDFDISFWSINQFIWGFICYLLFGLYVLYYQESILKVCRCYRHKNNSIHHLMSATTNNENVDVNKKKCHHD